MKLRTSDPTYLKEVDQWYSILLPKLVPMLYKNGGPIITVQVENEYGSYDCDFAYNAHLRDLFKEHLGDDVVLFTTDGNGDHYLKCGKIDNVFATVDFGSDSDPITSFQIQHRHQEFGPNVNSEYYPGWLDTWEHPHQTRSIDAIVKNLDKMLAMNWSVSM